MRTADRSALLVVAHGSRDPDAVAEFLAQMQGVRDRLPGIAVESAVLEFPGPAVGSIDQAVAGCLAAGIRQLTVLPLFLFEAGHVRDDIPMELDRARSRRPGVEFSYLAPILPEPRLLDVISARAREALASSGGEQLAETAMLLVGAGTSDPAANAELFRVARLLRERGEFRLVEVAFVSLAGPDIPEGVGRCVALGAGRVVVVPYFLNTGVLARRIARAVEALRPAPATLVLAAHFGTHPALLDLVADHARTALARHGAVGQAEHGQDDGRQ